MFILIPATVQVKSDTSALWLVPSDTCALWLVPCFFPEQVTYTRDGWMKEKKSDWYIYLKSLWLCYMIVVIGGYKIDPAGIGIIHVPVTCYMEK